MRERSHAEDQPSSIRKLWLRSCCLGTESIEVAIELSIIEGTKFGMPHLLPLDRVPQQTVHLALMVHTPSHSSGTSKRSW